MSIFGKEPGRVGEAKGVQDIKVAEVTKSVPIDGRTLNIRIQGAYTGIVDGKRELLDEPLVDNMVEGMARAARSNCSRYNPMPDEIIIRRGSSREDKKEAGQDAQGQDAGPAETPQGMVEASEPRFTLEQVVLNDKVRQQINTALSAVRHKKKMVEEWGMSEHFTGSRAVILNFYGKPGTGKSMAAEAVAKALGRKVYRISYSELESKYVGETPKNIRRAFECAARDNAVLIFDEADSFLGKRLTSVTQSADYGVNITRSVLLMELEKFDGIVVFTTNLISNYDTAFKRRILLSVYFEMPDRDAREAIWKLHLGGRIPLADGVSPAVLAGRYEGISGADIKDMVFYAALRALEQGEEALGLPAFDYACEAVKERYADRGAGDGFMVMSTETITEEQYREETEGKNG